MDDWFKDPFFNTSKNPEEEIRNHIAEVHKHISHVVDTMNNVFKNFGQFELGYDKDRNADRSTGRNRQSQSVHPTFQDTNTQYNNRSLNNSRENYSTRNLSNSSTPSGYSNSGNSNSLQTNNYSGGNTNSNFSNSYQRSKPIIEEPDDFSASKTNTNRFSNSRNYSNTLNNRNDSQTFHNSSNFNQTRSNNFSDNSTNPGSNSSVREAKPYFYSAAMTSFTGPDGIQHARRRAYDSATGKTEMAEMKRLGDQAVAVKREIDRDGKITDTMDRKNVEEKDVDDFRRRWDTRANQMTLSLRGTSEQKAFK